MKGVLEKTFIFIGLLSSYSLYAESNTNLDLREDLFWFQLLKMTFALALVLIVLLIGTWIFKRMADQKRLSRIDEQSIKIIERRVIGAKAQLYLIEVEKHQMLVAESVHGFQALGQWYKSNEPLKNFTEDISR
jgi:flagellar biogenesis protein FliO